METRWQRIDAYSESTIPRHVTPSSEPWRRPHHLTVRTLERAWMTWSGAAAGQAATSCGEILRCTDNVECLQAH